MLSITQECKFPSGFFPSLHFAPDSFFGHTTEGVRSHVKLLRHFGTRDDLVVEEDLYQAHLGLDKGKARVNAAPLPLPKGQESL